MYVVLVCIYEQLFFGDGAVRCRRTSRQICGLDKDYVHNKCKESIH